MTPALLAGQRVVVTRAAEQAGGLRRRLEAAGAEVELLPLLEVVPPADREALGRAAAGLEESDWVIFTSANAVRAFLAELPQGLPESIRVAAIGEATAAALRSDGVEPTLVASSARAEGLLESLRPHLAAGTRVVLPQAEDARPLLADGLAAATAEVVRVVAYRKRMPDSTPSRARQLFATGELGWVTFTSPSTVRGFAELLGASFGARAPELEAASIGPVTSAALRELGIEPAAEAERASDEGLVEAIVRAVAGRGRSTRGS